MAKPLVLHDDRLFPADPTVRAVARRLYAEVKNLPIISPHGHTNPQWFADDTPFPDPATLFIVPDHYIFRMLYSVGIPLESLASRRRAARRRWKRIPARSGGCSPRTTTLPRHADPHVDRSRVQGGVRHQ